MFRADDRKPDGHVGKLQLSEGKHPVPLNTKHCKYVKASPTQGTVSGDGDSEEVTKVK